jgi:hypothetical protein
VLNLVLHLLNQGIVSHVDLVFGDVLGNLGCALSKLDGAHGLVDAELGGRYRCNETGLTVAAYRVLQESCQL